MSAESNFRPINDDHAIESITFSILFQTIIPPNAIAELDRGHNVWRETLPAKARFDADVEHGGRAGKIPGIAFSFLRPDANPIWLMQIAGTKIDVTCSLYSRWERVWGTSKELFVNVLDILSATNKSLLVGAVDMLVSDAFTKPASAKGDASALFRSSDLLPRFALSNQDSWHSHNGWVERITGNVQTVHNLNIQATVSEDATYMNVTHYQLRNTGVDRQVSELAGSGFSQIDQMFSELHSANKKTIGSLIADHMLRRIGMGG